MSFILDALKKSETDRQRQSGPSLFEVKIAPPRRALPVWAVAIGVLLGINIIVVSWMLLRHPAAQQPASTSNAPAAAPQAAHASATTAGRAVAQAVQGAQASPGAAEATSNGRSPAAATYPPGAAAGGAPSVAAPGGPMASAGTTGSAGMAGSATSAAAGKSAALHRSPATASAASEAGSGNAQATVSDPSDFEPAVQPAAGAASPGAAGDLPLYQQIVSSAGLPALHLDLHVFADRPQDRFVMINMHRLGEGDSLPNGVHVEAIRPDGVVLSYQGTRFLLPRN